jgi:hypothetical protein
MRRTLGLAVLALAAAAVIGAVVAARGGATGATGARQVTVYEDASHESSKLVDNAPKSPAKDPGSRRFRLSVGDQLLFRTPLLDRRGGKRIGTLYGEATIVRGATFEHAVYLDRSVYVLRDGAIVVTGLVGAVHPNAVAVDGGSRAYQGARGYATATETDNGSVTTFHLLS